MAIREEIVALFRTKDASRFRSTLRGVGSSIKDVGQEARQTSRHVDKLSRSFMLNSVTSAALKDRMSLTRGEIMTTAITVGAYFLPAVIAMTGSLAQATLGAALLGAAFGGVMATGLSGFVLIAKTATEQFKNIKQAQDSYNMAVAQFGVGSLQAARASGKLYAIIQQNGGRTVWEAVRAAKALGDQWRKLSAPGRKDFFRLLTAGIGGASRLLPTFARESNRNMGSIRKNAMGWIKDLSGGEMRQNIRSFSQSFRRVIGPTGQGFVNLFIVMGRVLRSILPTVEIVAHRFEDFTQSMRKWSSDPTNVNSFVQKLVSNFWSWWRLLKGIGNTLRIVFGGGASEGQRLTDTLATQIEKLNVWLATMRRTGQLRGFFRSFVNQLETMGATIGRAWKWFVAVGAAIGTVVGFADSLGISIGDLAAAFVAYKVVMIAATAAGTLWNLSITVGTAAVKAARIAVLLYNAALRISAVQTAALVLMYNPWLLAIFAVVAAFALLYWKVRWFRNAVNNVIQFVKDNWPIILATLAAGPIGTAIALIITHFDKLKKFVGDVIHFIAQRFRDLISFIKRIPGAIGGKALGLLGKLADVGGGLVSRVPFVGGRANGGIIPTGTTGLVGERGPELAAAGPGGTMISPLTNTSPNLGLRSQSPLLSVSDMLPPVQVNLSVDGRVLATAVHKWDDTVKARRGER